MKGNDLSRAAWRRLSALLPAEPEARELLDSYAREWAASVERLELEPTNFNATTEHALWRSLCDALVETGCVTQADLKTSVHVDSGTRGNAIFRALRVWGDARRAHARAER